MCDVGLNIRRDDGDIPMREKTVLFPAVPASHARHATRTRFGIVLMLFFMTAMNYADRATLSITGSAIKSQFGMSSVTLGYMFSAFAWTYVLAQIPGGRVLDRFGSKRTYAVSFFLWSCLTFGMGFLAGLPAAMAIVMMFGVRILIGIAEAPIFPANSRIVATWFPASERGVTAAAFTSSAYFATVIFAPLMGWITQSFGWGYVYFAMGVLGMVMVFIWTRVMYSPRRHPRINEAELNLIVAGGALVDLDEQTAGSAGNHAAKGTARGQLAFHLRQILSNRMMLGILIGQYCVTTLTYFFLTWFPIYLVQERHMSILKTGLVASVPAIAGFCGGMLGGYVSDLLLKRYGKSLTFARKLPLVVGMLISMTMVLCNDISSEVMVVAVMALAFFGKGFGALGWSVMADVIPKQATGLCGSLFNGIGNAAGIVTPIAIGYLIHASGSFSLALVYVAAHAFGAIFCYLVVVGKIQRLTLLDMPKDSPSSTSSPASSL
jgi:ACS family glucarate transporter-like MFS transporter